MKNRGTLLALLLIVACTVAAKPFVSMMVTDKTVAVACLGPPENDACLLVTVFDSTANVMLASNVTVAVGDTATFPRPCTINETVTIGVTVQGLAVDKDPSDPIGASGSGTCSAQAGAPILTVEVVP